MGTATLIHLTIIPKIAIFFILLELQVKLGSFGPLGDGFKTIIVNNSGYLLNLNQINEFISLNFTTSPDLSTPWRPWLMLLRREELPLDLGESLATYHALAKQYVGREAGNIISLLSPSAFEDLFNNGANLGLNFFFESKEISTVNSNNILKTLLLISSTLSLIIGSLLGLAQIRIKRLLAYSTISHIGFILLALQVNTEQSIDSFIFYILQYTITNLNIFLVILGLTYCISKSFAGELICSSL